MGETAHLFDRVTDLEVLWQAWRRVKANRGAAGGDGESIDDFEPVARGRILRLASELRGGTYSPGPYRRLEVPKKRGGMRGLAIPCVVDRIAMAAAAGVLTEVLEGELHPASYGYRPGRSVRMAVDRVAYLQRQGYRWVVDGDIKAFFDEAHHDRLLARLARSVEDPRLIELVGLWLEGYAPDGEGLPQGSPISPVLANLYLDDIDDAIAAGGVHLVRFADDFLLLCKSEGRARGALERMAALLRAHGLELNPDKTRVRSFEEGFRFLGRLFVRSLVLESEHDDLAPETAELEAPPATPPPAPAPVTAVLRPRPRPEPPAAPPPAPRARPDDADEADEPGARPLAPVLRPLYVIESGRRLTLRNEAFVVMEDTAELLALPPGKVDRIELGPHVEIADDAIRQALAWRIPVDLLNGHGEPQGSIAPVPGRRFDLHLAQAACVLDPARRLDLARRLVEGRLRNQQTLLRRLNRRRKDAAVAAAAEAVMRCRRKLPRAAAVDEAMGVEGEAARHYWPALGRCLEHGWGLGTRTRRPAGDAVNAVLNWLSAMLTRDVGALVGRVGLHPGFGALHATRHGAQSCAFDLVEEFRSPLAEGLAVYLLNNRFLGHEDFLAEPEGGVRIVGDARATVIRRYEAWLDRELESPRLGRRTSWRGLMEEQVRAYARHCEGGEPYTAYRMDH